MEIVGIGPELHERANTEQTLPTLVGLPETTEARVVLSALAATGASATQTIINRKFKDMQISPQRNNRNYSFLVFYRSSASPLPISVA